MKQRTSTRRKIAWRKAWDGGWMGMNGEEIVYLIRGKYSYDASDYGGDLIGPSDDLQTVLEEGGLNLVDDATMSISSPLFSAEEIVKMLKVDEEGCSIGHSLSINGETWVCVAPGVLQRDELDAEG